MLLNATYCSFFIAFFFFFHSHPVQIVSRWFVCVCAVVMYSCAYMYLIVSSGVTFHSSVRASIVTRWVKLAPRGGPRNVRRVYFHLHVLLEESEREKKLFF